MDTTKLMQILWKTLLECWGLLTAEERESLFNLIYRIDKRLENKRDE